MSRDIQLKERWESVVTILSNKFADGETLDLEGIIYLIGVQELGKKFMLLSKKDEKVNLMHRHLPFVRTFTVTTSFEYFDNDGWPHKVKEELPPLKKQANKVVLMKETIVGYF